METVEEPIIHEGWAQNKSQRSPYDIVLLKLPKVSTYIPVKLPSSGADAMEYRGNVVGVGWGQGGERPQLGEEVFGTLKMEKIKVMTGRECNRTWDGEIKEGTMCGYNEIGKASCLVDSGSPLILMGDPASDSKGPAEEVIIGFNTDGAACGTPEKPDIYLDLRPHLEWIRSVLSGQVKDREL